MMASASKRPRSENLSAEEVSDLLFAGDEDHLGMSSDEESDIDRELDYQSGVFIYFPPRDDPDVTQLKCEERLF